MSNIWKYYLDQLQGKLPMTSDLQELREAYDSCFPDMVISFDFNTKEEPWTPKGSPECKAFTVKNPINTKFDDFKSWINKLVRINGTVYKVTNVERSCIPEISKGQNIVLWVK